MGDQLAAPFSVSRYDSTFSKVDCSGRGYKELPDDIFILKSVSHLSASGNNIVMISPKICNLLHLKSLDLSTNCITVVAPEIGLLCGLNLLNLQFNAFRQVPVQLCMLSNLRVLRLEGNSQLHYIPCELALCTQLLQLHVDGCNSLQFPRAKSIFGKPPVVPWLTNLAHDTGMNAMNYLKAMLAITALCASGKRRLADFSEICGADLQSLSQYQATPWHQSVNSQCASMTITIDALLPFVSEERSNKEFDQQANLLISIHQSDDFCIPDFENGTLGMVKSWLNKRFPKICTTPMMESAISLLESMPAIIDRSTFDSIVSNVIMLDRICSVLSILPAEESGFLLYDELGSSHVSKRLSKLTFYCKPDATVPKSRNAIFEQIPDTFSNLLSRLKFHSVVTCSVHPTIEMTLDGTTLFEQNRSYISELKFNRTDYIARGDLTCTLPNVQSMNIDFNNIAKLKVISSSTRLHTLSLKHCQCQEIVIADSKTLKLATFCVSNNELSRMDGSFQYLSQTLTWLDLSHNKLVELSSIMDVFLRLKYLNCSNNQIANVSVSFKHLSSLKHLNLSNNKIVSINDGILQFAASERDGQSAEDNDATLDLSGNLIAQLPTGTELKMIEQTSPFKNVAKLFLGCNPFRILPSDFFLKLERLQSMDFHNFKKVESPTQDVMLSGISGVRRWFSLISECHASGHLDWSGYKLKSIEFAVLQECMGLTSIDLSNNSFTQVPSVLSFLAQSMHTLIFDNNILSATSEIRCFPPELSCLTLLRLISMQRCGLAQVPDAFFALDKLCVLKLIFKMFGICAKRRMDSSDSQRCSKF